MADTFTALVRGQWTRAGKLCQESRTDAHLYRFMIHGTRKKSTRWLGSLSCDGRFLPGPGVRSLRAGGLPEPPDPLGRDPVAPYDELGPGPAHAGVPGELGRIKGHSYTG